MSAEDHLGIQFQYFKPGENDPGSLWTTTGQHRVTATMPAPFDIGVGNTVRPKGTPMRVGEMDWKSPGGRISRIEVPEILQRRGIGTAMFNEAHRLAAEHQRIPKPKHSNDRTKAGTAFAKSVGGRVPRLLPQ